MICNQKPGEEMQACPSGQGALPNCGPFAFPFVASQGEKPQRYDREKALQNGTLFPDLNLPFHLKVNPGQLQDTPLNQLRALDFVILELGLYLDTHPNDAEAFALYQEFVAQEQTARAAWVEQNGPLMQTDSARDGSFTWGKGPWPWQYEEV